jgi:hypothetical protein
MNRERALDLEAEREGMALARARSHTSVFAPRTRRKEAKNVISRDQAVFDEQLEVRYTECAFCGGTIARDVDKSDVDVCNACRSSYERLFRVAPRMAYNIEQGGY